MVTVKIEVSAEVAEYICGKYSDPAAGCVRFPPGDDIYITIYDLMSVRPPGAVDRGNLEFALPDRRAGDTPIGKNPEKFNYISTRGAAILARRFRTMMWAELHDTIDEYRHAKGMQIKEAVILFMSRYGIVSIGEDALVKNYQRWREKIRRNLKRGYKNGR